MITWQEGCRGFELVVVELWRLWHAIISQHSEVDQGQGQGRITCCCCDWNDGAQIWNLWCHYKLRIGPKLITASALDSMLSKATGNSRSGIPGNRGPQNSRREFPGISEILAGITGNFASFVFFSIFIVDYDILLFNLTAFWAKPWMTSLTQLFVFIVYSLYFQILISKNHWTASEFRKLRSLHEWGRWDNSNRS